MRLNHYLVVALSLCCCQTGFSQHRNLDYKTLLMTRFKLEPNYINYRDFSAPYLMAFDKESWNRVRNDEFERQAAIEKTAKYIEQEVENFDSERPIRLNPSSPFKFGNYDFERNGFPIPDIGETNYWYSSIYTSGLPRYLKVFFKNHEELSFLPFDENRASQFVKSRKDGYGNVDRNLYPYVFFKITGFKDGSRDSFICQIIRVEYYSDSKRTNLVFSKDVTNKVPPPPAVVQKTGSVETELPARTSSNTTPDLETQPTEEVAPTTSTSPAQPESPHSKTTVSSSLTPTVTKSRKLSLGKKTISLATTSAGSPPEGFVPIMAFATASPDFKRVGFTAEKKDKKGGRLAVIDGKPHPEYLIVNEIMFSPDSQRVMYKATPHGGKKAQLYLDGELKNMDSLTKELQFTEDSKSYVYVSSGDIRITRAGFYEVPGSLFWNGEATEEFSAISKIRVAKDSRSFAFAAVKNGNPVVVVNNKVVGRYDGLPDFPFTSPPQFSNDGKRYAFHAKRGSGWVVMVDGEHYPQTYAEVHGIRFSPDSKSVYYAGKDINGYRLYKNGSAISESYEIVYRPFAVSDDSSKIATVAKQGSKMYALVNGKSIGDYDSISGMSFSPNSNHLAFIVKSGGQTHVVQDGQKGPEFSEITTAPKFSHDSNHMTYVAKDGDQYHVVLDGDKLETADQFDGLAFSPDSSLLAYWTKDGENWYLSVNGQRVSDAYETPIEARPNQLDFENFVVPPKMFISTDNEIRAAAFRDNEFFNITAKVVQ